MKDVFQMELKVLASGVALGPAVAVSCSVGRPLWFVPNISTSFGIHDPQRMNPDWWTEGWFGSFSSDKWNNLSVCLQTVQPQVSRYLQDLFISRYLLSYTVGGCRYIQCCASVFPLYVTLNFYSATFPVIHFTLHYIHSILSLQVTLQSQSLHTNKT